MSRYSYEEICKKTKEFAVNNPWVKDMWNAYQDLDREYWARIQQINDKYTEITKEHGINSVELYANQDGVICGIDVGNGYGSGGYDFEKNQMLIQDVILEDLFEEEERETEKQ